MHLYLDWNVFNKLEKRASLQTDERAIYNDLFNIATNSNVMCPYSNAHLNDLLRGYNKDISFIDGHLNILKTISKNVCICQYWGQNKVIWHKRDIHEFFNAAIIDSKDEWQTFDDLLDSKIELSDGIFINPLIFKKIALELKPVPIEFKKVYQSDPIFNVLFPNTKNEMNEYALCSDIYNFSMLLKKDFALYKTLKKFLIQTLNNPAVNHSITKLIRTKNSAIPKHLEFDEIFDNLKPAIKEENQTAYNKFLDTFFRYDIKGYKSDGKFSNMLDDAIHSYYGAHCDYFITNDDKCKYKAEKTYERLNIKSTKVMSPIEFINQ
jgi:hypothetical protein